MLNDKEYAVLLEKVRRVPGIESLSSDEFMSKLITTVVESYEDLQKARRRAQQLKAITEAKKRGVRFGRLPMERPENSEEVLSAYRRGELSSREAAEKLGVTHKTVTRWADG